MYSLIITLASMVAIGTIGLGLAIELNPSLRKGSYNAWFAPKSIMVTNLVLFVSGVAALSLLGVHEAIASAAAEAPDIDAMHRGASVGLGLEIFAIAVPTAVGSVAAGMAVAKIGAAGMAVLVEKPEVFGKTIIYMGLAEGIAIYGLVISILMLGKI
jgi:V/A-type H+-transporting ATPase subunit K